MAGSRTDGQQGPRRGRRVGTPRRGGRYPGDRPGAGDRPPRRVGTLRLLGRYFHINLAAHTAYPGPFAIQVIAMAANDAMFLASGRSCTT